MRIYTCTDVFLDSFENQITKGCGANAFLEENFRGETSLIGQWLRIYLPMQGMQVQVLVRAEILLYLEAAEPCATTVSLHTPLDSLHSDSLSPCVLGSCT